MAKSKTPAKRARRAEANRLRNKARKSRLNTAYKKFEVSMQGTDIEQTQDNFIKLISLIDKGVSKGILHKNTAARKKSALAKRFNAEKANLTQTAE
ncbi:MAG: 30S ribosomal protein S20 [Syntrophomonadaceae bacterium]|nr:30S ribosomal protein S20 [Syntrophomonadaceae bacterium]